MPAVFWHRSMVQGLLLTLEPRPSLGCRSVGVPVHTHTIPQHCPYSLGVPVHTTLPGPSTEGLGTPDHSATTRWQGQTCLHTCFVPTWPPGAAATSRQCHAVVWAHVCIPTAFQQSYRQKATSVPLCPGSAIWLASMPVCMPAVLAPSCGSVVCVFVHLLFHNAQFTWHQRCTCLHTCHFW